MVEELRRVLEQVQQEEERDWDTLISSQEGQAALERLASEARAEIAQGKTRDLEDLL